MARLKKAEKIFIVRSLAQFMTPTEVVKDIKVKFSIDVSPQQVEGYDPTKVAGAELSQEFIDLFNEARKEYLAQPLHNIIGANDIVQLQILSDLLVSKKGNTILAIKLIDQIQKIMKGHYEKKIEIYGKDGGPIKTETEQKQSLPKYTPDELANMTPQELSRLAITGKL
ncbi:DUF2280 domain-containing protein [Acinetobacter sichuanensis]|uniref:DUF2280 domain-containing protein n=1 Tax=Acinetobacter sichuanensis TaxID=2136183 RepID=UPI00280DAAA0|nr:DUF2280 domain-containing protein [Acinetobacter sichuanensis]MDQ9023190.1 DUF2280 domain-containing protein [Acinetobacter sichuanensis]